MLSELAVLVQKGTGKIHTNKRPKATEAMTSVSKQVWIERMNNLNERRAVETIKNSVKGVDNYKAHIEKAYIGRTVLDVGCGSQTIAQCLPDHVSYMGIDPFPGMATDPGRCIEMDIEECTFPDNFYETVYAFAMLDNVYDLKKALENIKRVCSENCLFLTGVDIEPDKYHTVKITEDMLNGLMHPFKVGYREKLHPKILLIEYIKPK